MLNFEDIEDEYYNKIKPLEEEINKAKFEILEKYSDYFKEKFNIEHNGYVLLVYNYYDDCYYYADNITLYFYDKEWKDTNEYYTIFDRHSSDDEEFNHKYKDIDTSENIHIDFIEDIL